MSHRPVPRLPALLLIVVALAAGGLVDRHGRSAAGPATTSGLSLMATAGPADALSSTWYCAGASDVAGGPANGAIVLANTRDAPVTATVEVLAQGQPAPLGTVPVTIPAMAQSAVPYQSVGQSGWVGAIVSVAGGGVAVSQEVAGSTGIASSPCASAASQHWYFPAGSTAKDNALLVSLLNPFPDDAIADLTFVTEGGNETPDDFQGLVIPARTLLTVDVGTHVRRRDRVATTVTVRRGRLVAERLQLWGAAGAPKGLVLGVGAPAPATRWDFAYGMVADATRQSLDVLNPSGKEAQVEVALDLDQGAAEPFTLTVPPGGVASLDLNAEARVPRGVVFTTVVRSLNGVAVVPERRMARLAAPNPGTLSAIGAPSAAHRWVIPDGVAPSNGAVAVVFNPGTKSVHATVRPLDGGAAPAPFDIGPGQRWQTPAGGAEIDCSDDVVVEHFHYNLTSPGQSSSVGVPLR